VLGGATWYLLRSHSQVASDAHDLGDRVVALAERRGVSSANIDVDERIAKVDGLFVRTWRIRVPTRTLASSLIADLEAEAAAWGGTLSELEPDAGDLARLRLDVEVEAYDLHIELEAATDSEVATPTATPSPIPTPTPRPTPPPWARGQLAILLDDGGQSLDLVADAAALPQQVGVSVLPFLPHSAETAAQLYKAGHEIWLHLPMEPLEYPERSPGPGAVLVSMSESEIRMTVRAALNNVPHVVGVNNHMGSKASADVRTMTWVMQEISGRGLCFIDSRTTADTVAEEIAQTQGVVCGRRHVFLDNNRTPREIRRQLEEAVYHSRTQGEAIAIGHLTATTVQVLSQELPHISQRKVDLVSPSQLLRDMQAVGVQ